MSLARGRKHEHHPKVEINIIPLVDVALVLLIIVMVTATFSARAGMPIQLPTSSATRAAAQQPHDIVVGVDRKGGYYWQGRLVSDAAMNALLAREMQVYGPTSRVIVQADTRTAHGRVVSIMTLAQQAGFARLVVATQQSRRTGR
jgi:biopolymer transport protein ExbD